MVKKENYISERLYTSVTLVKLISELLETFANDFNCCPRATAWKFLLLYLLNFSLSASILGTYWKGNLGNALSNFSQMNLKMRCKGQKI